MSQPLGDVTLQHRPLEGPSTSHGTSFRNSTGVIERESPGALPEAPLPALRAVGPRPGLQIRVAQLGARMHYAVPRILSEAGLLESVHTDLYATSFWRERISALGIGRRSKGVARFLGRWSDGIPEQKVATHPWFGVAYSLGQLLLHAPAPNDRLQAWAGSTFASLASRRLDRADVVYGFITAAQELFAEARARNVRTCLEQTIAPSKVETKLLREGADYWPGWASPLELKPNREREAREEAEWALSDRIVCGSEFVRSSLGSIGGPVERCRVVPYGVALSRTWRVRFAPNKPIKALFVGALGLRKGVPCLLEAAKLLGKSVHIRVVGAGRIPERCTVPENVEIAGSCPRSQIQSEYEQADLFVLPSFCEGSATVTYEALSAGLPVICTPNTGSVVRHEQDGLIIPPFDVDSLVGAIRRFQDEPNLLEQLSYQARERAEHFDLHFYGRRLLAVMEEMAGEDVCSRS
jgi:glycosyltransferase involved in cell wall biosynthesis